MSRRGRTTGVAISLFSFQDIITSVTAIMILLVLILTLELVSRTRDRGVATEHRKVASDLRASVTSLEQRAQTLRAEILSLQTQSQQAAEFSESETKRRRRAAGDRTRALEGEIDLLQAQLRAASVERRRAEAALVTKQGEPPTETAEHVARMVARAAAMEKANQLEQQRQRDEESRVPENASSPTLFFNAPAGDTLTPRLVELSGSGLVVPATAGGKRMEFSEPGGAFRKWLQGLASDREYVVLIMRPSGLSLHHEAIKAVEAVGLGWGLELVGESMPVMLGERK